MRKLINESSDYWQSNLSTGAPLCMSENKVYQMQFNRDGFQYAMKVLAGKEEAEFIADSLGLSEPEEVIAIIPDLNKGMH